MPGNRFSDERIAFALSRALKLSQYPFSHALPGRASHGDVPRGGRLDVGGPGTGRGNPIPDSACHQLRTVVRPDVGWDAPRDEKVT